MTSIPVKAALAAALTAATAAPAFAQYQPTPQYQRDLDRYQQQREDYRDARNAYDENRDDYDQARDDYERRRDDYQRAQADYDRRYGYGAYARRYGAAPVWDEGRWNGDNYRPDPYRNRDARNGTYDGRYDDPCRDQRDSNGVAGGLIGALAGAALGSAVADRGVKTEGAVLGAVVGGAAGVAVGRSNARCDGGGYYYSYADTVPYRESVYDRGRRSGRYDYAYYNRQGCRLATAPADWNGRTDYRYVRVCPDRQGRYRITG